MEGNEGLAEEVADDSRCLWRLLARFIHQENEPGDCEEARECYARLKVALAEYLERRLTILAPHEEWFAVTVLDAYEDLTARNIVH